MGLDMYLNASRYISPYGEKDSDDAVLRRAVATAIGMPEDETVADSSNRVTGVTMRVTYWRKANQIHKWFVDNVQDGDDNCRTYDVSREQLDKLREACEAVFGKRDDPDHAEYAKERLPNCEGCFFGNQEYDAYYYSDLKDTIEALSPTNLDRFKEFFDFEYRASW